MTDIWEEVPRNEYYKTFKEVVDCPGFKLDYYEGDIFSIKEENDNVITYFYELEGKFYVQSFGVHEVKSMKIKRQEEGRTIKGRILLIGLHEDRCYEYVFEQTHRNEPKGEYINGVYYCYGYDCRYKLYLNDKQVKVERLGILFPPEMKRKTVLL